LLRLLQASALRYGNWRNGSKKNEPSLTLHRYPFAPQPRPLYIPGCEAVASGLLEAVVLDIETDFTAVIEEARPAIDYSDVRTSVRMSKCLSIPAAGNLKSAAGPQNPYWRAMAILIASSGETR
jgi:hypothetical protein